MKIQWSAFFSILALTTLVGCGAEQFGTTPQSTSSTPDPLRTYEQSSCSSYTLVKPKVDIVYLIDNTQSYYYSNQQLKDAISSTISTVSSQFDYRIIITSLVNPNQDLRDTYQNFNSSPDDSDLRILTNSDTPLPSSVSGKKIISVSELSGFPAVLEQPHRERGLWRLQKFMNRHRSTGLLRQGAYNLMVLVSNNRDVEVENVDANGSTSIVQSEFTKRYNELTTLRSQLQSQEFRLFSIAAKSQCVGNWIPATHSYLKMAETLHGVSDAIDLCSGNFVSLFAEVNNSIRQVVIPHEYRLWPITFADNSTPMSNFANVEVYKFSGNNKVFVPASSYQYYDNGGTGAVNILTTTDPAEFVSNRRHFIRFNSGAEVTYPDCIQIKSTSRTEVFNYVVLQREPRPETIYVTINGRSIPQSSTNGWVYRGNITVPNIKVPQPSGSELPPLPKSGFMIELKGADNYYKSGDNVQVNYIPAAI